MKLADWHAFCSQGRIDDHTLAFVRKQFTVPEIIEIGCYFAMVSGFQKFNSVFQIEYACPIGHPIGPAGKPNASDRQTAGPG